ncbi:MAG TPA: DegT/DnrJ/EryC1/StrS aminotransferase family protein [Candidatus Angelobacter sp.]|nr:DegT/DnrJ/EryC1/StrS aminotransferase family protein [Candidatus Angelobacter sp.]
MASQVETLPFAPWPYFAPDEIAAAVRVLESGKVNYWTGDEGRRFELEFAKFAGCQYGVAVANGTVALELALRAVGVELGDEVITASRTFIASASCAVALGARPVCADVDRNSGNVTADTIRAVCTPATKAIVAVHLAGWPCEMDPILDLARERGLKVVEDCAQAHGAMYRGRPVGSLGDAAAFSFCQDKIMTTAGEGGMVTTNSYDLWQRMWSYKDHGKNYDKVYGPRRSPGFRWLHDSFGTNWRLSEVQSAVGRIALGKLPQWLATRRRHAAKLTEHFSKIRGLRVPVVPEHMSHAYYKYYVYIRKEALARGWDQNRISQMIVARGIPCGSGSCSEVYLENAFPNQWRSRARYPVARELGETSLMFLVHPTLTEAHMDRTCEIVGQVLLQATRAQSTAAAASGLVSAKR